MQQINRNNLARCSTALLGVFLCFYVFVVSRSPCFRHKKSVLKTSDGGFLDALCGEVGVRVVSKTSSYSDNNGVFLYNNNASDGDNDFYASAWPPLQRALCGEGAPNLALASMLFELARDEVFPTTDQTTTTDYAPTRPLGTRNTKELERSIKKKRPTQTAVQFFSGSWGLSALDGKYYYAQPQDSGGGNFSSSSLFKTRYIRIWKAGNDQIRALEEDLAEELGITDNYKRKVGLRSLEKEKNNGKIEPCIYTVVRDPIQHFLSGYNEIEWRTLRPNNKWTEQKPFRKGLEAPYHTDFPYNESKHDDHKKKDRFRAFVEDLLVEDGSFLVNGVYQHCFPESRVLSSLAAVGRRLDGYLPDLTNLTQRWPGFLADTCPGLPPLEAFPKAKRKGQHGSSRDPLGTYNASREVWAEGGPTARALCLLSAPDYACYGDLPAGIPEFCQAVYRDHAQALTEYGHKHYMVYQRLH